MFCRRKYAEIDIKKKQTNKTQLSEDLFGKKSQLSLFPELTDELNHGHTGAKEPASIIVTALVSKTK